MQKKLKYLFLFLAVFFVAEAFSQNTFVYMRHDRRFKYKYPLVGIGGGGTVFRGDLGSFEIIQPQLCFNFTVDNRLTKKFYRLTGIMRRTSRNEDMFGWSVNATKYFVASDYQGHGRATYFNSTGWIFDFRVHAYMEKYLNLYRTNRFSPYFSLGFGYLMDANTNEICFPTTFGTKYRISNALELGLSATRFYTTTDKMDWDYGYAPDDFSNRSPANKANDNFIYLNATLFFIISEIKRSPFY
jgi:hypothetical protein